MPGAAALELARFARPDLDLVRYLDWFDDAAARVGAAGAPGVRRVVAIEQGIGGNVADYYLPENSFLDRVIETRRGIPISLSVIWIEVARRAGLEAAGVGLPGHFLVQVEGELIDPFHYGESIGPDEAAGLVAGSSGGPPRLEPAWLEPVPTPAILVRMLRNLDAIYRHRGDVDSLEWVHACLHAFAT